MNAAQQQALLLGVICFASAMILTVVLMITKVNRFGVFAVANCLMAALLFGAQAVFGFSGWRSQVLAASVSELPVVLLISWVCVAQVGGLTTGPGSLPSEPVVRRPRTGRVLGWAPAVLLGAWTFATLFGVVFPSPAMQVYASAPPQFLLFKWPISIPQMVYAGLAAVVFALAAVSSASARVLRLRNVTFSLSFFLLALIAAQSAVFAGVRVWAQEEQRRAILDFLLGSEAVAALLCLATLAFGLALRYTPVIAAAVVRTAYSGWLPARERLEASGWHAIAGGQTRGVARLTYRMGEAAKLIGLSPSDADKAVATIQLMSVMQAPSSETARITTDAARELYEIEREIQQDEALASRIEEFLGSRWDSSSLQPLYGVPLREPLKAALELTDGDRKANAIERPLWFYLVAAAATDMDPVNGDDILKSYRSSAEYSKVAEAYTTARDRLRSRTFGNP